MPQDGNESEYNRMRAIEDADDFLFDFVSSSANHVFLKGRVMEEQAEVTLIQAASAIVQTFAGNPERSDQQLFDAAKKFLIAKLEK